MKRRRCEQYRTCRQNSLAFIALFATVSVSSASAQTPTVDLSRGLVFYASFDDVTDANLSTDDGWIHTASNLDRNSVRQGNHRDDVIIAKGAGRFGDALRFKGISKQVLLYKGVNIGYRPTNWSGTIAFWLKLDPEKDLKPGFCDPIQITDKKWNDAAMWVDFDKDSPRDFRLGTFPDYQFWNPKDLPYDNISSEERPWVPVKRPPFSNSKWTHVAWTFEHVNSENDSDAKVKLFLNGKSQGTLKRPLRFTWAPNNVAIMLGINYVGDFDDLVIFNRPLNNVEIRQLGQGPAGNVSHGKQQ